MRILLGERVLLRKTITTYEKVGFFRTLKVIHLFCLVRFRSLKLRIARFLGRPNVKTPYQVKLIANWTDQTFLYCAKGTYGKFLSSFILQQETEFTFLDVGANQGLYSLIAARNENCVQVHAFEPVPMTFEMLEKNVALNNLQHRITLTPAAISNIEGNATIYMPQNHSGAAFLKRKVDPETSTSMQIKTIGRETLNQLVQSSTDMIVKVDVEGHEPIVLAELMKSSFASRIQAVFYEVETSRVDPSALQHLLSTAGFTRFSKIGQGCQYDILAERTD